MVNYIRVQNPLRIDPTTFHTSKLVASSDHVLCGPCQRLLEGENTLLRTEETNGRLHFAHHTTAESFLQALSLPCGICRRLRVKISRDLRMINRLGSYMYQLLTFQQVTTHAVYSRLLQRNM